MSVIHMTTRAPTPDPFAGCAESCTHDLAKGILVEDLLGGDGPHPPIWGQATPGGWLIGQAMRTRLTDRPPAA